MMIAMLLLAPLGVVATLTSWALAIELCVPLLGVVIAVVAAASIGAAFVTVMITTRRARLVRAITDAIHHFAVGELGRRLEVNGSGEVGLVQAFNKMAEVLEGQLREASRLSVTDGLTSVSNRRLFDLRAAEAVQRGIRFGEPFSLVLVDLDDFKRVNDRLGHQTGDAVLVELATRFAHTIRAVDLVARFGGEEFVFLLPKTTSLGAVTLAEKVRIVAAQPVTCEGHSIAVTVSAGVACYPEHGMTVEEVVAAADAALYQAKAAGKDRVERAKRGPEAMARKSVG
jgi:diguanylate cyclase (GGDEF)-like protein